VIVGWGHRTRTAGTVADALALSGAEQFDLLLCDLGLPDGTGCDVLAALPPGHGMRTVALTGFADAPHVEAARRAGFMHYIEKPLNLADLEGLLLEVAAFKRIAAPPAPAGGVPDGR
jgi:DNA-binding NtrC family response regulator